MAKPINFSNFLSQVEEYEKVHVLWCAKLVENGRQTIQSVCNNIDNEHLTNLTDSFMRFVSLLALCNPEFLPDKKPSLKSIEQSSKQQNESLDLVPKNDIIQMVNNDLQCPICNEWLLRATSANCNHTFCEKCIKKWLKMNKTCPVCRSSVQYTSTSLAVDNFISNLCGLIGGFIKDRRESVKNTQDQYEIQTSLNNSVDEVNNDLSIIDESIVEDTYNSLLEITTPTPHPNMVRLIPLQSRSPESRINFRQVVANPGNVHSNAVELLPFSGSSILSTLPSLNNSLDDMNNDLSIINESIVEDTYYNSLLETITPMPHPNMVRLIPLQSDSPESRLNLRQLVASPHNVHSNAVELLPFPRSTIS